MSDYVAHERGTLSPRWRVVVAPTFLAAVDSAAPRRVIWDLWALAARRSPSIEELVGAVPLVQCDSFAVVRFADGAGAVAERTVTAVVRGDAALDVYSVGGSRRFTADGVEPWLLADFRSVIALAISAAAWPASPSPAVSAVALPFAGGSAEADRVLWAHESVAVERSELEPAPAGADAGPRPRETTWSGEARSERPSRHAATTPIEFAYRFGDGGLVPLTRPTVFGRRPAGDQAGEPAALVTLPSPTGSVSASHVLIAQQGDSLVVTDLNSTNGTRVMTEGAGRVRLRSGESVVVPGAAHVDVGDGNIIEVMPARTPDGSRTGRTARGTM